MYTQYKQRLSQGRVRNADDERDENPLETNKGESDHQRIIRENRVRLVEHMDLLNTLILDQLVVDGVLAQAQVAAITEMNPTNNRQVSALLNALHMRPAHDWEKFKKCLQQHNHEHVVRILDEAETNQRKTIQSVPGSSLGGVGKLLDPTVHSMPPAAENRELRLLGPFQLQMAYHYRRHHSYIHVCQYGPYLRKQLLDSLYIPPKCTVHNMLEKKDVDVSDIQSIFQNAGETTSTFVTGLPGSGKTTAVNRCLSSWADLVLRKHKATTSKGVLNIKPDFMYDLIICVFLRNVEPGASFSQTIKKQIWCDPYCYPDIEKYISENPSRVLIILDGLDEYSPEKSTEITAIIKGELLPNASKIVTSRHTKANSPCGEMIQDYERRVQINGFDDPRVRKYLYKYHQLPEELPEAMTPTDRKNKETVDELFEDIKTKNMLSLCQVPLHLCFFCQIAEADGVISTSKTKLYLRITKYTIDLNISKTTSPSDFSLDNIQVYHDELIQCGTGALNLLRGEYDRYTFRKETKHDDSLRFIETGIKLGLIISVQPEHLGDTKFFTFSHLSIQEFLASYAIVHDQIQRQVFILYLTDIFRLHDCRNIISFCCGLSEQCGNELLSHAVQLVQNSDDNPTAHQCPFFNRRAWHSGKVDWEAEIDSSRNIIYFLAQSVSQYNDINKCDFPIPPIITLDLSQTETESMLEMFKYNKSQSTVRNIVIENGNLSSYVWDTTTSVIGPHELIQLSLLDLNTIEDSAALAASIKQMKNLIFLNLEIQSLTENDYELILAAVPKTLPLVRLFLRYFHLSPREADLLSDLVGACHGLVRLVVTQTDLSLLGQRVTSLVTSPHLALLEMDNTHLTQEQLTSLCTALPGQCPQLLELNMSGNDISGMEDRVAEAVSNLHHLSWLTIRDCNITSEGLWRIMQHLPKSLCGLDISDNGSITHFSRLSECFYFIKHLRFLWCKNTAIPADVMRQMFKSFKQNIPDLTFMHDYESGEAGEEALNAFIGKHVEELNTREVEQARIELASAQE